MSAFDQAGGEALNPMLVFSSPRLTPRESVVKLELEAYGISEVHNREWLKLGDKVLDVNHRIDLPDVISEGLTFKLRLVEVVDGSCYLLARWKPEPYMRRTHAGVSRKWFVEKELFPRDVRRFFLKQQEQLEDTEAETGKEKKGK